MIFVTRLDKSRLLLNLESVKYIESTPDTFIFFLNGDSVIVQESLEEIERRVLDFRVSLLKQFAVHPEDPSAASHPAP
jgi:flagellar protein FlbD